MSSVSTDAMPLFPLQNVVFPGGPLSLRIFEPRYLDMVSRCMREGSPFVVVRILDGQEVGPVKALASIGTTVRIRDFDTLPEGLLGLTCIGERRVRVLQRFTEPSGLHVGRIEYLPEQNPIPVPPQHYDLEQEVRDYLPTLGALYPEIPPVHSDAGWLAFRVAELVRFSPALRQDVLELTDPLERFEKLCSMFPLS